MLTLLLPAEIEALWPSIGPLLSPAVAFDEARHLDDVKGELIAGEMALFKVIAPTARGLAVIEFGPSETADRCCWLLYAAGSCDGGPKAWLAVMRMLMGQFEGLSLTYGCTEMRVQGRDWSRVLSDYQPTGNARHQLVKRL